ncbi:RDD family protein [Gilvibacter sediminis]|uniref:RDD family protein n=1 Tax=Gilvibacter sediminis TaxID=379071 RepID=UPI00235097D0|nr:RDD family protein [Gilvibacter sediminis]MDC7998982.1 RDD family protein [Gilvibacter sediminis]
MANLQISTTQNVNLGYTIASAGERILALLVDLVIFILYFYILSKATAVFDRMFNDDWSVFGLQSLLLLPIMFYSLYMHILFDGRTVGKMCLQIRVVKLDGSPVHWSNYMVRWMMRIVDLWVFPAIGLLTLIFSERQQRIGDSAAGTVVISTKKRYNISSTILEEIEQEYTPKFATVTQLSDKDARLIKETYRIAVRSNDYKTLNLLRVKVESLIGSNSDLYDRQYIDTVLKDYNYYTQSL